MIDIPRFDTYKDMKEYYKKLEGLMILVSIGDYASDKTMDAYYFSRDYYDGLAIKKSREIKRETGQTLSDLEIRKLREKWQNYAEYIVDIYEEILTEEEAELTPWIAYETDSYSEIKRAFNKECKSIVESGEYVNIIKEALEEATGGDYSLVEAFRKSLYGIKEGDSDVAHSTSSNIRYKLLVSSGFPTKLLPIYGFDKPKENIRKYISSGDFVLLGDHPFENKNINQIGVYEFFGMPTEAYEKLNEKIFIRVKENLENNVKLTRTNQ